MTFVVTLVDYVPGPRYPPIITPWTQARIDYASMEAGPFTTIDTIALTPLDLDPTKPEKRSFTTTNSPVASGWFRVTFLDADGNEEPTDPVSYPPGVLFGAANPTLASALNAVRHRVRDGVPVQDANPLPFNMVRLESLSDQVPAAATPVQTVFQCRYEDVPTQRYMNAQVCPGTLVAYLDGSWVPTEPAVDVDQNGNFTLPVPPVSDLLITYAWQYLSDGEIYQFIDEARQWLREFSDVTQIPDGLVPALVSNAASRALEALSTTASRLALVRAGDSEVDWSALTKAYQADASKACARADAERAAYYTQGPEALDPTAAAVSSIHDHPYTPER